MLVIYADIVYLTNAILLPVLPVGRLVHLENKAPQPHSLLY
jgi:hypothetical protein